MNRLNLGLTALTLALAATAFAEAAPAKPKACCSATKKCCTPKSACCKDDDARGKCKKTGKPKLQCCASKASPMPPCCQKNCPPDRR